MDTEKLLQSLNERRARYVVIGATAFPVHGYARATLDIDLFIEPTPENATRVKAALADFGYDVTDLTVDDRVERSRPGTRRSLKRLGRPRRAIATFKAEPLSPEVLLLSAAAFAAAPRAESTVG